MENNNKRKEITLFVDSVAITIGTTFGAGSWKEKEVAGFVVFSQNILMG